MIDRLGSGFVRLMGFQTAWLKALAKSAAFAVLFNYLKESRVAERISITSIQAFLMQNKFQREQ